MRKTVLVGGCSHSQPDRLDPLNIFSTEYLLIPISFVTLTNKSFARINLSLIVAKLFSSTSLILINE